MDSGSQTSFIPKKPITSTAYHYDGGGVSIVTVICIIVFFGSVALAVGAYLYQNYLLKQLTSKQDTLNRARSGFDIDTIKSLQRLDLRIQSAHMLLDQHIAASAILDLLEKVTLKSVQFSDFSLSTDQTSSIGGASVSSNPLSRQSGSSINIKMRGKAGSYASVALQADKFSRTAGIREPIFSNLNLDDSGAVSFDVTATIDPKVLNYRSALNTVGSTVSSSANTVSDSTQASSSQSVASTTTKK